MKGLRWPFANSNPANTPQILSFKSDQQDIRGGSRKPYSPGGFVQGNVSLVKQQEGNRLCPAQSSTGKQHYDTSYSSSVSQPHDARPLFNNSSQINQMLPATKTIGVYHHRSHYSVPAGQDDQLGSNVDKPQSIVPPISSTFSANCAIVGTTDLWNTIIPSSGPAQLTIFYNGLVSVYDHIPAEKAQAIMLLAGNGNPPHSEATATAVGPSPAVQLSLSMPLVNDGKNEPNLQSSIHPAPISVLPPHTKGCSGRIATTLKAPVKEVGSSGAATSNLTNNPAVPRVVGSPSVESGLPQARKASLARFLEKRRERLLSTFPYVTSKKASKFNTSGADATVISTNATSSLQAINL